MVSLAVWRSLALGSLPLSNIKWITPRVLPVQGADIADVDLEVQATETRDPAAEPAFAWLVGLLALPWFLHAGVVLCSTIRLEVLGNPTPAWLLITTSLVGAFFLARSARRRAQPKSQEEEPPARPVRLLLAGLQIAGAIAFFVPLLSATILPIIAYDAISYRLPVIAQWLDAGRIAWVASDDPVRNGYPLGVEAITALIAAASGSLRFAGTTSYLFVAAAAAAIVWLARVCDVRAVVARAAAASFLLVPMLILNAPSGYVDAAFASACVCLFCSATLCVASAPPWVFLAAGMSTAHVLALKGTGLPFAVLVVGLCVLRALLQRRSPSLHALGAFALAALPGLFWPLRNVINTGNPLWPIRLSIAGKELLPGVGTADQILDVAGNTPALLASHAPATRVLLTWLQWTGPALDFDYRLSGLGFAWLFIAVPSVLALAYVVWRAPSLRTRYAPVGFVLLLTAACFALQPMAFWSRYTLWLWGLGALAIGCLFELLLRARAGGFQLLFALAWLSVMGIEAGYALAHVHGIHLAVRRYPQLSASGADAPSFLQSMDLKHGIQAKKSWIAPEFWALELTRESRICRGEWKPSTDNANLDGVLAQLSPRPTVNIVRDDNVPWSETKKLWREARCPSLILFRGSPVLGAAQDDPEVRLRRARAFDALYVVRWREPKAH
jgi:hypothetical protein